MLTEESMTVTRLELIEIAYPPYKEAPKFRAQNFVQLAFDVLVVCGTRVPVYIEEFVAPKVMQLREELMFSDKLTILVVKPEAIVV